MNTHRNFLRRLREKIGYTVAEAMLATLLVALLSTGVATGVSFAGKQYRDSMIRSEEKVLMSTLTEIITGELRNTPAIYLKNGDELDCFFSRGYAIDGSSSDVTAREKMSSFYGVGLNSAMEITYSGPASEVSGQLLLGREEEDESGNLKPVGNLLVSSAAYTTYDLKARLLITYSTTEKLFDVVLTIEDGNGKNKLTNEFYAMPLNDIIVS